MQYSKKNAIGRAVMDQNPAYEVAKIQSEITYETVEPSKSRTKRGSPKPSAQQRKPSKHLVYYIAVMVIAVLALIMALVAVSVSLTRATNSQQTSAIQSLSEQEIEDLKELLNQKYGR